MTCNSHLAIKLLAQVFMAYMNVLRKYLEFSGTYTRVFKDLLSALDAFSNARLIHYIIDQDTLERYCRAIAYHLTKPSPNYELVFSHT